MATIWPFFRHDSNKKPRLNFAGIEGPIPLPEGDKYNLRSENFGEDAQFTILVEEEKAIEKFFSDLNLEVTIETCAIISSAENRLRQFLDIGDEGSIGESDLAVGLAGLSGCVTVEVFSVLADDITSEVGQDGVPTKKGSIIGTYPKILVNIDVSENKTGNEFPTKWISFKEREELRPFSKSIHFVDLTENIVLINDDLPQELKAILQSETPGNIGAMRQALFAPVSMFASNWREGSAATARNENGVGYLEGHYKNLIEDLAPILSGYDDFDVAIDYLNEVLEDDQDRLFDEILATNGF